MRAKTIIALVFFFCIVTKGYSQSEHSPYYPMHKWLGEWTITEMGRVIDVDDYLSMEPRYERLKVELLEDKTSVLWTQYICFMGYCDASVAVYVPSGYKSHGVSRHGKIEISYPGEGKEVIKLDFFPGSAHHHRISETHWHSQDSVTTYRVKMQDYRGEKFLEGDKGTNYTRLKKDILPLPETLDEIGDHLGETLKRLSKNPFDFADQFISLEDFHCLSNMYTSDLDFFFKQEQLPKTELERIRFLNYDGFSYLSADDYWISWRSTKYTKHSTTDLGDTDTPFHQVDFRFEYREKEYLLKALYVQLRGKYHLVYIKHKIYP